MVDTLTGPRASGESGMAKDVAGKRTIGVGRVRRFGGSCGRKAPGGGLSRFARGVFQERFSIRLAHRVAIEMRVSVMPILFP